jgi:cation diffusion facilitator CzcD-associated flavoprotein CzcO
MSDVPRHDQVIVGAGFSGLGMAIRLEQEGKRDYVVLERGDDVGGAWWANTYPGCRCDVPSHLYSFSFAPNPRWTRTYSPQQEILEYLRDCSVRYGVRPRIRFGTELSAAHWQDDHWRLETSRGPLEARVLVLATGPLSAPALPDLPGLDRFAGATMHSGYWDHDHDLTGDRVAVIGTGASAIQFVPAIQPQVGQMHVFQRTPPWLIPHTDRGVSGMERRLFAALPPAQLAVRASVYWAREALVVGFMNPPVMRQIQRVAEWHLRRQVPDPGLREKLRPSYRMGCKRILLSNDWYPALSQPNVELVSDAITEVRERSIVTADGRERDVDTIIFGTGFLFNDMPIADMVHGRGGRSLASAWNGTPEAYRGTTFAGFPNLFMLIGPNTGLGHTSVVVMAEFQIEYVADALRVMDERRATVVEVRPEAQSAYNADVQKRLHGTVWTAGGCTSWYLDDKGRDTVQWPGGTRRYRRLMERFDEAGYELALAPA